MKIFIILKIFALSFAALAAEPQLPCEENDGQDIYKGIKERNRALVESQYETLAKFNVPKTHRANALKVLNEQQPKVCTAKKAAAQAANDYQTAIRNYSDGGCAYFKDMKGPIVALKAAEENLQNTSDEAYKKLYEAIVAGKDAEFALLNEKNPRPPQLEGAYQTAWGMSSQKPIAKGAKLTKEQEAILKQSVFMQRLFAMDFEKQKAAASVRNFSAYQQKIGASETGCTPAAELPKVASGVSGKETGQGSPNGDATSSEVDANGVRNRIESDDTFTNDADGNSQDLPVDDGGQYGNGDGGGNLDQPEDTSTIPPEDNFFSRNKETLIVGGAGVAAVGGLLYYMKHEKDKEKKSDAAFARALTTKYPKTVIVDGNNPNADPTKWKGKKLMMGDFPTILKVGELVPPVLITIVDENNNPVADTNVEITVTCTKACSISGTANLRSNNGTVTFSDLKFNAPHPNGMQLRFSSPNLNDTVTPGSFVVEP